MNKVYIAQIFTGRIADMIKLSRDFYLRDACIVAHDLIGKILVHGSTSGIIVETEAYKGPEDKASHSYNNRRTNRTEMMYHAGGHVYIYMIYGMYYCFNVVANIPGKPEAVLVRALEPLEGLDVMMTRRNTRDIMKLCSGPGKLCGALGIGRELYGEDLCGEEIYITDDGRPAPDVKASPRINIDYAEEYRDVLWRYFADGSRYISR